MGEFFRDYGTPFLGAVAVLNTIISLVVGQYFKDSPRARAILVGASVILGLVAVGATFYSQYQIVSSARAQNENRIAMKKLLGAAIYDESLAPPKTNSEEDAKAYEDRYKAWSAKTAQLIDDAYGEGEASRFMNYAGIQLRAGIGPNGPIPSVLIGSKIDAGLQRLNELIERVDTLSMQPGFDPKSYHPK